MSHTETPPDSGPRQGPRVTSEQMRDLQRLRRSRTDRHVAGVAGGLGRHFDLDPTVIRVLFVVLAFFGGAGLALYGAIWLLVPVEGEHRAPIDVGGETRKTLLIAAAVVAGLIFLGATFSDHGWGWGFPIPLFLIAIVAIVVFVTRDRRDSDAPPPAPWTTAVPERPNPSQEGTTMTTTQLPPVPPEYSPPAPPAYAPPPPPRPRRTGLVLFWPTLALVAIALGSLGVADASYDVPISAYPALALSIVGVMLLVGAFVGRPGGLIALGLVAAMATGVTGLAEAAGGGGVSTDRDYVAPRSASELRDSYTLERGELVLDLTRLGNIAALDGRSVQAEANAGRIEVIVPRGLNVDVDAAIRYAGHIEVADQDRGGFDQSLVTTLTTSSAADAPSLDLHLELRVGEIVVVPQ